MQLVVWFVAVGVAAVAHAVDRDTQENVVGPPEEGDPVGAARVEEGKGVVVRVVAVRAAAVKAVAKAVRAVAVRAEVARATAASCRQSLLRSPMFDQ